VVCTMKLCVCAQKGVTVAAGPAPVCTKWGSTGCTSGCRSSDTQAVSGCGQMAAVAYPVESCVSTLASALYHKDGCIRCHGPDGIHGPQVQVSEACRRSRGSSGAGISRGVRRQAATAHWISIYEACVAVRCTPHAAVLRQRRHRQSLGREPSCHV
jgi:hypothetical protein